MTESLIESVIFVVGDLQEAVPDTKRVSIILAKFLALDLCRPPVKVFAIEQLDPRLVFRIALS